MDQLLRRFLSEVPKTDQVRLAQEEVRKYLLEMEKEDHPEYALGDSPKTLERAIRARLLPEDYEQEVYGFVAMTCRLRVLKVETVFRGGISDVKINPAILLRRVLVVEGGVHTVAMFHTHPSGETWPSRGDVEQHQVLREMCSTLNLRCVDHLILGVGSMLSFAEENITDGLE